jgi:hypothetical protein
VVPVFASHYAAIADGFFSAEITAIGNDSWRVAHRGALQTLRFDDAADLAIDFGRSVGVIGQQRKDDSLYVALDEAFDEVIVALAPAERGKGENAHPRDARPTGDLEVAVPWVAPQSPTGQPDEATRPHLIEGRWTFREMRRQGCGFSVMAKGFGSGQMSWGGLKAGLYRVTVRDDKESLWDEEVEVRDDGRLAVVADAEALSPVEVEVACIDGEGGR